MAGAEGRSAPTWTGSDRGLRGVGGRGLPVWTLDRPGSPLDRRGSPWNTAPTRLAPASRHSHFRGRSERPGPCRGKAQSACMHACMPGTREPAPSGARSSRGARGSLPAPAAITSNKCVLFSLFLPLSFHAAAPRAVRRRRAPRARAGPARRRLRGPGRPRQTGPACVPRASRADGAKPGRLAAGRRLRPRFVVPAPRWQREACRLAIFRRGCP